MPAMPEALRLHQRTMGPLQDLLLGLLLHLNSSSLWVPHHHPDLLLLRARVAGPMPPKCSMCETTM